MGWWEGTSGSCIYSHDTPVTACPAPATCSTAKGGSESDLQMSRGLRSGLEGQHNYASSLNSAWYMAPSMSWKPLKVATCMSLGFALFMYS